MKKRVFMRWLLVIAVTLVTTSIYAQQGETKILIETNFGNIYAKLYNDTPIHKSNFIRLANAGRYDGTLFFRVVKNFVIQGASSDSKNPKPGMALGYGDGITIDAEIKPHHYHKRGALCAPRQPDRANFFKESDISQFYIVVGKVYSEEEISNLEKSVNVPLKNRITAKYMDKITKETLARLKKEKADAEAAGDTELAKQKVQEFRTIANRVKKDIAFEYESSTERLVISPEKRKDYTTIGGLMHLDGEYTVFGEVTSGMDVVEKIVALPTDPDDRPLTDVKIIEVKIL